MFRHLSILTAAICLWLVAPSTPSAAEVEVHFAVSGVSPNIVVSPDTINGLNGTAEEGRSYRFSISLKSSVRLGGASLGFLIYSPDGSLSKSGIDRVFMSPAQASRQFWDLSGGLLNLDLLTEFLPSRFLPGGIASIAGGFLSDTPAKIVLVEVTFPEAEGVYCIDSAFFPPAVEWLTVDFAGNNIPPAVVGGSGDLSVGGSSSTAFCVTVIPSCCETPGDANSSGGVNIADVTFLIQRINAGAGAAPECPQEADANADGRVNIADITFLIRRIFMVGPAPVCASTAP